MLSEIIKELKNPGREFSPVPFWFLNDRLEKAELKRQMEDFCEKGVNGVVLHPRIGIPVELEYLSEEYFDIIKFIVKTAKELDMLVVLYDEAMYPSGSAHGLIVRENPALASTGITLSDLPDGEVIAAFDDGKYIVNRKTGGTIRGIHFGEDDGEANVPPSADILNPAAVDKFIELTHEQYYRHLKEYFGTTVIGFFTDEPCVLGRNAVGFFEWTDGFEDEITAQGGDLKELRALFEGGTNPTVELYRRLVTGRLNAVYYKKLSDWCAEHSIALMGHPEKSDDIDEEQYFHIPGQDLVFRWVSPEKGGTVGPDSVQAKCSADAARHLGRRRNSNECFGVCSRGVPWYFTADDMKWFIDWLGVRGVNMFIPHAFYYSIDGKRRDERPPDVGPNNIWWRHYKLFSDYMKRISYIMTGSKNCADVAVLCKSRAMPADEVRGFYENQIEFNYLPYSMLGNAEIKDGKLCVGGYEYKYVMGETDLPVKKITGAGDIPERDFLADAGELRVSHIVKNGVDMYFVVNEGAEVIETEASIPCCSTLTAMDLWGGEYYGIPCRKADGRAYFDLKLPPRESLLILLGGEYPEPAKKCFVDVEFELAGENPAEITKEYVAYYEKTSETSNECIRVSFDEMAECYVNGSFCGVSFFGRPFEIGSLLKNGRNEIRLVVTGSVANRYSDKNIPYGINK